MTASPLIVLERTVQLHQLLEQAGVAHAVGGALALAYHVREARATRDIDLNVAVSADTPEKLFRLLPAEVPWGPLDVQRVRESGQVRLLWPHPGGEPAIPLDLFFPQSDFHEQVNQRAEWVTMLDAVVPIVSATDLMVFKLLFDRRKDWADIEELLRFGKVDVDFARSVLTAVVGSEDPRQSKLDELLAELSRGTA